jgi:uncharacterized OsmC-like protein
VTADRAALIRDGLHARASARDGDSMRGLYRIELTVTEGLTYEARNPHEPDQVMRVDEPPERGGSGDGSSPLSHFLTGVGACLLNQFVRVVIADGLAVRIHGASVRGEFRRHVGGAFERIVCTITGSGELAGAAGEALVERAEALCYVHCTLSRAIEMVTVLELDGRERVRRVAGPGLRSSEDQASVASDRS